jgi:hypothetical protein
LVNSQIAAGASNQFVHGVRVNELETVAKGTLLANHRMNRHGATWKREFQLNVLTQGCFNWQHGPDSGFANIHTMTLQQSACPRMDCDINLNLESGLTTAFRHCLEGGD